MRKVKISVLVLILSCSAFATDTLITVPGSSLVVVLNRNRSWPATTDFDRYTINSPNGSLGFCLFLTNNNNPNARNYQATGFVTSDIHFVDADVNFSLVAVQGGSLVGATLNTLTTASINTSAWFFPTFGATKVILAIGGTTGTAGGSNDTYTAVGMFAAGCPSGGNTASSPTGAGSPVVSPNQWSINNVSSAGGTALATNAATTGVRHTAVCYSASIVQTSTTTGNATFQIKNGSTVVWAQQLSTGGSTGSDATFESLCGLQLVGTPGTAMSCTFSGAAGASAIQSCSLSGFDQ